MNVVPRDREVRCVDHALEHRDRALEERDHEREERAPRAPPGVNGLPVKARETADTASRAFKRPTSGSSRS